MVIFLNKDSEIFDYAKTLVEYKDFYVPREKEYIPKTIVSNVATIETLPEDFEIGKYKYINGEFVENENFVPYTPPEEKE